MQPFELARVRPQTLLVLSIICAVLGAILLLWLLARGLERLLDRPRVPRPGITYGVFLFLAALVLSIGTVSWGINRLLLDHARVVGPTQLGQLRCEAVGDGQVRMRFTRHASQGGAHVSAPVETTETVANACGVQAHLVTMRFLSRRFSGAWLARVVSVGQNQQVQKASPLWNPESRRLPVSLLVREVTRLEANAPPDAAGAASPGWAVMLLPPTDEPAGPAVLALRRMPTP